MNLQPMNGIQHFMMMFYLLKANLNVKLYVAKDMALMMHKILATNGNYRQTIIDYNYRFGGIETIFKNQMTFT